MIRRTLVPEGVIPPVPEGAAKKPRRLSTLLDSRSLIPSDLPIKPLDGGTAIPSHVPLDVLAKRSLVPRDLPPNPLTAEQTVPLYAPLSVLDARMVVPVGLPAVTLELGEPVAVEQYADVIDPDVITTGDVNLMPVPEGGRPVERGWVSRTGSLVFHVVLVLFLLLEPKIFPYRQPSQADLDLARRQLSFVYLPPDVRDVPRVEPRPEPPGAQIRVDPRILRQVAPDVEPSPMPGPPQPETPRVQPELPNAPRPQLPLSSTASQPAPERSKSPPRLDQVQPEKPASQLLLPQMSPGRALEESAREALQDRGGNSRGFADPIPPGPGTGAAPGGGIPGGGGGQGYLGGNLEMLTPDQGVDFSDYFARMLASVRRNWYAVIPESARMGEKGRVVLQFRIARNGDVPYPEPMLTSTSGREALDHAAMSAIRASSPFEPLPPAFTGPYIELRFTFLYNLPLDYR
jgi:TonB family protein